MKRRGDGLLQITKTISLLNYFFEHFFAEHLLEFFAAVAGSIYLWQIPEVKKITRFFVYFLWMTFFIDLSGFYTTYAYLTGYENLEFIRNTPFERNFWLYNSYKVLAFMVFFFFFIFQLNSKKFRKILTFIALCFGITAVINLLFSGVFFTAFSAYTYILGTVILILCITTWYYEILTSDEILVFYKNLAFYISVGALAWHVAVTPLFIYSRYFTMQSPEFVSLHSLILKIANIFMYTCFTISFLICSQKKSYYF